MAELDALDPPLIVLEVVLTGIVVVAFGVGATVDDGSVVVGTVSFGLGATVDGGTVDGDAGAVVEAAGVEEFVGGDVLDDAVCEITIDALVDEPLNPWESAVWATTTQVPAELNVRTGAEGFAIEHPVDPLLCTT